MRPLRLSAPALASVSILGALASPSSPLAAQGVRPALAPVGEELVLVSPRYSGAGDPRLAAGVDGFVLVWTEVVDLDVCCEQGVFAQRLDLSGAARGTAVRVDPPLATGFDERIFPDVAAGVGDGFVVVWHDIGDREVHGRRFDARGVPHGRDFVVNTYRDHWQTYPRVASDPNGAFAVAWVTEDVGDDGEVWPEIADAQRFGPHGVRRGGELRLNVDTLAADRPVAVALGIEGEMLAAWGSFDGPAVYARLFDSQGVPATADLLLGHTESYALEPELCSLPGGRFLAAWLVNGELGIMARRVERDGTLGPAHRIDEASSSDGWPGWPELACDRFGAAVAVYLRGDGALMARRLGDDGAPLGEAVEVTDWRAGPFGAGVVVSVGAGGRVLVAWEASEPAPGGGSLQSIRGRILELAPGPCVPSAIAHCLGDEGRFRARAYWHDPHGGGSGVARAGAAVENTGTFWLFGEPSLDLAAKVVDGEAVNGHSWVFFGSLSTVEQWLEVYDSRTPAARRYRNPPGRLLSRADTRAFAASSAAGGLDAGDDGWQLAASGMLDGAPAAPRPLARLDDRCAPSATRLCLGGRFAVVVAWELAPGVDGVGQALPLTADGGAFWFFREGNLELLLEVLDHRRRNGHFWVTWSALTSLEVTITVTDTATGAVRTYRKPRGKPASGSDRLAF